MTSTIIIVNEDSIELFPFRQYQYKRTIEKGSAKKVILHSDIPDTDGAITDEDHILLVTMDETYRYNLDLQDFELADLYSTLVTFDYKVELTGSRLFGYNSKQY